MVMTAAHWAELLEPVVIHHFFTGFSDAGRRTSMIPSIYGVQNSERAYEEHLGIGSFGTEGWNFVKSGRVQYGERNKGYLTRITHVEFARGFMVQRRLIDDNQSQVVFDDASQLGDSAFTFREKAAALLFTNAFTDSGTDAYGFPIAGGDGVGLCSLVHPNGPDDAGTQANEGTLALSTSALSTTRQAMAAFGDDRGELLNIMPNGLLIPPELEDTADVILRSTLDPNTANNAVNIQQGRFSKMVWHYLTDATDWFMLDTAAMTRNLLWYERIPVEFGREQDFDTFISKFRAYMRFSRGFRDWRWVFGQHAA